MGVQLAKLISVNSITIDADHMWSTISSFSRQQENQPGKKVFSESCPNGWFQSAFPQFGFAAVITSLVCLHLPQKEKGNLLYSTVIYKHCTNNKFEIDLHNSDF